MCKTWFGRAARLLWPVALGSFVDNASPSPEKGVAPARAEKKDCQQTTTTQVIFFLYQF